jgi:hypothetical protein
VNDPLKWFCRFLELSTVLEPGKPPKTDKATILSDAVRILTQLRSEAQQLQDSNNQLRDTIKDLKVQLPTETPCTHATIFHPSPQPYLRSTNQKRKVISDDEMFGCHSVLFLACTVAIVALGIDYAFVGKLTI